MPRDKDLKRLVRARMKKTGESYTAARAVLLDKKKLPDPEYARLAGMADDTVRAKTGRTWKEWTELLDGAEAYRLPHREIAEVLYEDLDVGDWWAQMVTVGYERIRGLRAIGQRRDGNWDAGKSKTVPVPISELYRAFAEPDLRRRWLPVPDLEVLTATPHTSMRVTWEDGTSVSVYFTPRGAAKSTVSIQHEKLPDRAAVQAAKDYWGERLEMLAALLAGGGS